MFKKTTLHSTVCEAALNSTKIIQILGSTSIEKTRTHTASWLTFYLVFFFTFGTSGCGTTQVHQIHRDYIEIISDSSELQPRVISTLQGKEISVHERLYLRVYQDPGLKSRYLGEAPHRRLVPFHFGLNGDLVTPSQETGPYLGMTVFDRSPFTLTPSDRFEIQIREVSIGKTLLGVGAVLGVLMLSLTATAATATRGH